MKLLDPVHVVANALASEEPLMVWEFVYPVISRLLANVRTEFVKQSRPAVPRTEKQFGTPVPLPPQSMVSPRFAPSSWT